MTYYKYVERDATSQVNWADVSKKFSDEIERIGGERDKKRAEIDKATDELVTKINEAPLGQHKNANLFTSQLVDQATEDTLRMNRLLKSGDIKPSEYMNYIENQKSSVTGIYDMVKGYQDVYTDKMTRLQNGDSLSMEADGMAVVEGFGNFANITPVMDMYGNVTMYNNSTGDTMSAAQMNAITKQYFNAYDLDGDLTAKAGQLGEYTKSIMEDGVKTREDVTASPAYQKVKNDLIAATLEGNLAVSTVLDRKLPGYSTSYSAKTAGANDILMIDDPRQPGSGAQIPLVEVVEQVERMTEDQRREIFPEGADVSGLIKIAKDQREAARNWAEKDLISRFNMIETAMPQQRETETQRKTRLGAERTVDVVTNIRKLHSLKPDESQEDVDAATSYVQQLNPNVRKIELGDEEIVIRMKDGDLIPITKGDQADLFVESIINAVYKDKAVNLPDALKKAGVYDEGLTRHTLGSVAGIDETLDFDEVKEDLVIKDPETGETGSGSPKSLFIATTTSDEEAESIAPKQTTVMQQMGIEDAEVGYEEMSTSFLGFGASNALRLNVPSMFPQAVLISEEADLQQVLLNLNQLISDNRGSRLTEEQLKAVIPSYDAFNNEEQRARFGIEPNVMEEEKMTWTQWSSKNPGGTAAEYRAYFSGQ
jgi:hypothetical protein